MKKILTVLTGGTIGSVRNGNVIGTEGYSCRALELYKRTYGNDVMFEVLPLMDILSENLQKHHWETMVNTLSGTDLTGYEGIIITHGSDTLSYTSAFLGICLRGLDVPVVLTAADRVPDDPRSNAVINLRTAVNVIRSLPRGVYTVYKNPGDDMCSVYLSVRLCEADRFRGCFSAPEGKPLMKLRGDTMETTHPELLRELKHDNCPKTDIHLPLGLSKDVMMFRPYPGMDYDSIQLGKDTGAVLHLTYHSSSACVSESNSALSLLRECKKHNTGFYLASFRDPEGELYQSSRILLENGAVPLPHITDEAAYAKLLLAVNTFAENSMICDFMQKDICHEFLV